MPVLGHWDSLGEAQKLSQNMKLSGVIETVIEGGQLIAKLPVKQISGLALEYNREVGWDPEDGANFYDIGDPIVMSKDVEYTKVTTKLSRIIRQDPLDKFIGATYGNINDYRALLMMQATKRVTRFAEYMYIYGNTDNDNTISGTTAAGTVLNAVNNNDQEFDGLHALALSSGKNIDEGEAGLSLGNMRRMLDLCKVRPDQAGSAGVFWLFPETIHRRLSQAYMELGIDTGSTNVRTNAGLITQTINDAGRRVMAFDGIPIITSDYLTKEGANTGVSGTVYRTQPSGGTQYSVFLIRPGQTEDGGLSTLFGGSGGLGELMEHESFEKMENYDAGMERMKAYVAPALGAKHSLGRIYDIEDVAVVI